MANGEGKSLRRQSSWVFGRKGDEFYDAVSAKMTELDLKEGDVLVKEGDNMPGVYMLKTGTLERSKSNGKTGQARTIDSLEPGRITGLLHTLKAGPADKAYATITATTDCKVRHLPKDELIQLVQTTPAFSLMVMEHLARELRASSKIMRQLYTSGGGAGGDSKFQGMKLLCYDSSAWVKTNFNKAVEQWNKDAGAEMEIMIKHTSDTLTKSSCSTAAGYDAVCLFVNDTADAEVLKALSILGVKMVAMRCAGFDRVDGAMAEALGMTVARVPAYSPYAVAEHAVALLMALNRKIYRAVSRVRDGNFVLDGLTGFDLHGKRVGVFGTGKIGMCLVNILLGYGVDLVAFDPYPNDALTEKGGKYVDPDEVWSSCDVVFLFSPLLPSTKHMFNYDTLKKLKKGMTLINTSRGGLIETGALLKGLREGTVAGAGLDVYENEAGYFFRDCSDKPVDDPELAELLAFNNVILTGHQAFFTQEAIDNIVATTMDNIRDWATGKTGRDHPNTIYK